MGRRFDPVTERQKSRYSLYGKASESQEQDRDEIVLEDKQVQVLLPCPTTYGSVERSWYRIRYELYE